MAKKPFSRGPRAQMVVQDMEGRRFSAKVDLTGTRGNVRMVAHPGNSGQPGAPLAKDVDVALLVGDKAVSGKVVRVSAQRYGLPGVRALQNKTRDEILLEVHDGKELEALLEKLPGTKPLVRLQYAVYGRGDGKTPPFAGGAPEAAVHGGGGGHTPPFAKKGSRRK